jgi:1,4-dihydroxy-6-naphthoate synthase
MRIAFSPCPNDTFVFHAWAHGLLPGAPTLDVTYADIDKTNHWLNDVYGLDVLKISCAAIPQALTHYQLLPCGGALGNGCGPLVLHKETSADPAVLRGKRIAVPSEQSTAYLLFRLWAAAHVPGGVGEIVVMPFDRIMPAVRDGAVDAGLVIHEARFTYHTYGLACLVDLGEWWERDTSLPIPLGAIVAHRRHDPTQIADWVRRSVQYAWEHRQASRDYIRAHAQELDDAVTQAHIELYVNHFTTDLGDAGYGAIEALLSQAADAGLVAPIDGKLRGMLQR